MNKIIEIRWHGRGGQGAKTASLLLADAAFNTGKFVQGFPEYGPERMGAPITAYNRISDDKIELHSNIYEPDYVVVLDESLIDSINITDGLKISGGLLVNSPKDPSEIKEKVKNYNGNIHTIDAGRISIETIGKNFPNTPMLAAIVKVSNVMDVEKFLEDMKDSLKHKFSSKPEVIAGNLLALKRSTTEIKSLFNDVKDLDFDAHILDSNDNVLGKEKIPKEISEGGLIVTPGNSENFNTGDWRSVRPVLIKEKCRQCLLCCPVCPDSSIPVKEGLRLEFDYDHCKGCGICKEVCPFDAIKMENENF